MPVDDVGPIYSPHALTMLQERHIERAWVEAALGRPDWIETDPTRDRLRAFKVIPLAGNRILRVVYVETEAEIRVITVFFDRNAKNP